MATHPVRPTQVVASCVAAPATRRITSLRTTDWDAWASMSSKRRRSATAFRRGSGRVRCRNGARRVPARSCRGAAPRALACRARLGSCVRRRRPARAGAWDSSPTSLVALVRVHVRRIVARRLARSRVVDPEGRRVAHVDVHEGAVRVVPAPDVPQAPAEVPDDLVRDPEHAEIDRLADVVVRVRRVLQRREGAEAADDLDLPAAEMVRHRRHQVNEARLDRVREPSHRTEHLLGRLRDRRRDLPAAGVHVEGVLLARRQARRRERRPASSDASRSVTGLHQLSVVALLGLRCLDAWDRERLADLQVLGIFEMVRLDDRSGLSRGNGARSPRACALVQRRVARRRAHRAAGKWAQAPRRGAARASGRIRWRQS